MSTKVKRKIYHTVMLKERTIPQKRVTRRLGISQKELASRCGLTDREVSMTLRGERRTPRVQEAIARVAGMTVRGLFGRLAYTSKRGRKLNGTRRKVASLD